MGKALGRVAMAAYTLLLWLSALWLAWLLLLAVDFLYPVAYRLLDIPTTLATYVPQNRQGRQNFILTDAAEHARLFAAITQAVRHDGAGLQALRYHDPQGRDLGALLTADEITHLRDVAQLVAVGERVGLGALASWSGLVVLLALARMPLPKSSRLVRASLGGLALLAAALLAFGPFEAFYAWHRWVFPADHPWFFYYQDSLMSSLMQAPNLFAFIGVLWLATSLMFLPALHALARLTSSILMPRRFS